MAGAGAIFAARAGDLKIDRWELTNTQFYEDLSASAPAETKVYRMKRAAAEDEGAEGCVKQRQEVAAGKRNEVEAFCKALFAKLAPTLQLVLQSGEAGPVVLQAIDVDVRNAYVLKSGHGFFADEAYYDLTIRAEKGERSVTLRQPLKFTKLGTLDLRLGFDLTPLGPEAPTAAVEFTLTFRVEGAKGTSSVKTGLIRMEL
jgi:hypothetical protein